MTKFYHFEIIGWLLRQGKGRITLLGRSGGETWFLERKEAGFSLAPLGASGQLGQHRGRSKFSTANGMYLHRIRLRLSCSMSSESATGSTRTTSNSRSFLAKRELIILNICCSTFESTKAKHPMRIFRPPIAPGGTSSTKKPGRPDPFVLWARLFRRTIAPLTAVSQGVRYLRD
jgi:hypothetical protein